MMFIFKGNKELRLGDPLIVLQSLGLNFLFQLSCVLNSGWLWRENSYDQYSNVLL